MKILLFYITIFSFYQSTDLTQDAEWLELEEIFEELENNQKLDLEMTFYEEYFDNGFYKNLGRYLNDSKHGLWVSYYYNGQIKSEGLYNNNKKISLWKHYTKNGYLDYTSEWSCCTEEGEPISYSIYYDKNGSIIRELSSGNNFIPFPPRPYISVDFDEYLDIDTLDFMDTDIEGFDAFAIPTNKKQKNKWKPGITRAPEPKRRLNPRYPDLCKHSGIEGKVVAEFYVDEKGNVDPASIEVLKSIPCLDEEVIKAIKKSKWKPARQGKKKTGLWVQKAFEFKLD